MLEGFCNICEKTKIWERTPNNRISTTPEYCEIWLAFSDDTVARHAICINCKDKLTKEDIDSLFEKIQEHWINEGAKKEDVYNMSVEAFDIDFQKIREKHAKVKEEKHKKALEEAKKKAGK